MVNNHIKRTIRRPHLWATEIRLISTYEGFHDFQTQFLEMDGHFEDARTEMLTELSIELVGLYENGMLMSWVWDEGFFWIPESNREQRDFEFLVQDWGGCFLLEISFKDGSKKVLGSLVDFPDYHQART